jgi:hypothetical protein
MHGPHGRATLDGIHEQDHIGSFKKLKQIEGVTGQVEAFRSTRCALTKAFGDFQTRAVVASQWIAAADDY